MHEEEETKTRRHALLGKVDMKQKEMRKKQYREEKEAGQETKKRK